MVEPSLDLGCSGRILISGQFDANLDFTERDHKKMMLCIVGRLTPGGRNGRLPATQHKHAAVRLFGVDLATLLVAVEGTGVADARS